MNRDEKIGADGIRRPVFLWSALVALIFTLIMLQWSFDRFRLHSAPFLDDVYWFNEGIALLDSARAGGIPGFFGHIAETRTLAPYSIVAAAGFALFGIRDWAPYLMNGWLVFCLLAFLEISRSRLQLPRRTWFLAAALALAFPISGISVISFVGDHATGLFTAIGAIAFLQGWPESESALESWAATVAWVFAFYGKSTLFPETLLIFLGAAVAGCAIAMRGNTQPGLRNAVIRRWLARTLPALLVMAPYYIVVRRELYDYLYVANFGAARQIWAFKGLRSESLLYYLTGFSGETMLGPALYLAAALIAIRAVVVFSEEAAEKLRFAAILLLIAFTYALPTWTVNKTPTVAAPFQFLVALTAVVCLFAILKRRPLRPGIVELLVACAVLMVFRFPQPLDRSGTPAVTARNQTMTGLMAALEAEDLKSGEPVFLTTTGYVSVNTLVYEFRKRSLPVPRFFELVFSDDPSRFPPMIDQAAYVIATEPGNDEVYYTAPSSFIQAQTLALMQQNPTFVEIARFNTWRGKRLYLFGRRGRVKNLRPEILPPDIPAPGPVLASGFLGPNPDGSRWSRREFEIEFPAPRGLFGELKIRFFLPKESLDKLGPITLQADIEHEGTYRETYAQEGAREFTYRYAIKQHLVATVVVRFRLDKESGILFRSGELNPVPNL